MPERQLRILLVEDHPFQLLAIQCLLKSFGYDQLTPAANAEQAIKLMRTTEVPFDVMLCDQCLPDLTGLELVEIASHAGFVKSAVLLSSLPTVELEYLKTLAIQRDLRLLGYLPKPLNKEAWIELISQSGLGQD